MIKDLLIALVFFAIYIAADMYLRFTGIMLYVPILILSLILGYLGDKWSWLKVLSFLGLFLIIINFGILNRSVNDVTTNILVSWLGDITIANLKITLSILAPASIGWLLKRRIRPSAEPS